MRTVDEIKAAAAALPPEEQIELFQWWMETNVFRQRQLAELKRQIAAGIEDLDTGRYQAYNRSDVMRLAEEISRTGCKRISYRHIKIC